MKEKEIYSFLYMLYELKQGIPLYNLKYDFISNLENTSVGTDDEGTVYNVYDYDFESVDVNIKSIKDPDHKYINVLKIELCESFDIHSIPSMRLSTKDLTEKIHTLRAIITYFDEHADDVKMLKLFEDNDVIVTNIASKPNFKLSDIQNIFDIIAT